MLLTEEEYNKEINFKDKQIENSVLALKFHNAVTETLSKILEKDEYYIHSILDSKTKIKMISNDYFNYLYPQSVIKLEFRRYYPKNSWYSSYKKKEIQYFELDKNKRMDNNIFSLTKGLNSWSEIYYKDFIKFTSLQSKSFKKKLIKIVYIFENEKSDKKYRKVFNFLVNYFKININKRVDNYDRANDKLIDDTKLKYYKDTYYLSNFEKVLKPRESRNRQINKILKSNDLVDNDK